MNYYKILEGKNFIGVGTSSDMRKYQKKHNIILISDENSAEYIQIGDSLYHDNWLCPVITDKIPYAEAQIIAIEKEEYDLLFEATQKGEEIPSPSEGKTEIMDEASEVETDSVGEITVEYVKSRKVAEMSRECNKTIEKGVDVTLSDGQPHHFSLTTQDQLNLISLQTMIISGQTSIPYHADNEPCRFFSSNELQIVLTGAMNYITYHESYFNSLKVYINSFEDIESISKIEYGIEIPEEYQTDVLRQLIASKEQS